MNARQRQNSYRDLVRRRGKRYDGCKISNYEITCDAQRHVLDEFKQYATDIEDNVKKGRGVILFGPKGTGKDHLMMGLAGIAIVHNDMSVEWANGLDLYARARHRMRSDSVESEYELVHELARPDILYLSDPLPLGQGELTQFQMDLMFRLIDARYSQCRPNWITINVSGRQELDERIGPQVADRLIDDSLCLFCNWESHRKSQ